MALIYEGMMRAICEKPLDIQGPLVATTHFVYDHSHPLWRFSDAAMHDSCFQSRQHRETFVETYNHTVGRIIWGDGTQHHMKPDGTLESIAVINT